MSVILGCLCVAALVVAWGEHRAAERLVDLSKVYMDEGRRSWDLGEQKFREAIAKHDEIDALLRKCQDLVITPEEHNHE